MENKLSKIKLGILGGGQLARMLALKCHELGIKPFILSANKADPAAEVSAFHMEGDLQSKKHLKKFLKTVDLATFENEFLNMDLLEQAAAAAGRPIHPKPKVMHLLQDRITQKKLLEKHNIPTAYFRSGQGLQDLTAFTRLFPHGAVLKKRRQGYDGGGVKMIKNSKELFKAKNFILKNKDHLMIEEFVPFKKEAALILARSRKRQIVELPLVETHQKNACCVWVKGPSQHKQKNKLVQKLKTFLNHIDYEGVMAFELFDTPSGDLWVNEIAPRVHNSGHYSLDALSECQFTLHIKAVLNLNLTSPMLLKNGFAMLNLLGGEGALNWKHSSPSKKLLNPEAAAPARLYWYGKVHSRLQRKMGHVNVLASTPAKALNRALQIKKDYSL